MTDTATGWESTTTEGAKAVEPEPEPAAKAPEPEPEPAPAPVDNRQRWTCVTPEGPRTHLRADGPACAVFHSDTHLGNPPEVVRCPTCGGTSVRKAFEGEV